ncbi:hypothetical protein SAMN04487867_12960 [Vreelandella titanicae]|uniref:hypothetical protein n=1 Tax=Vreelandella titanicae TaxID=664683 RepID=UPI0008894426|nr:hypothetical protein [Halomonas titanicae]SDJ24015.1 hypothetical protein SAMN04487867_12960 [Halomonas titanicae]
MATRKTTAPKAKQAAPTKAEAPSAEPEEQEKAESVPETPVDTVAPNDATAPDAEQVSTDEAPAGIEGDTITGDGSGKALPPMEEMPGVFVRTKRRIKSRRRAGYRFNREGTGIALELLSKEQLKQLREDPALEVEDCTFPLEEATSEPEA